MWRLRWFFGSAVKFWFGVSWPTKTRALLASSLFVGSLIRSNFVPYSDVDAHVAQIELAVYDREGLIVDELLGAVTVSHTRFSPVNGLVESWLPITSAGRPTAAQFAAGNTTTAPEVCTTIQYIDAETRTTIEAAQKLKTDVHHRRKEMRKLFNIEEDYIHDFSCNLDGSKIPGSGRVYITATQLLYNSTFKQKILDIEDIRSVEKYKTMLLANAGITLFLKSGRKIHLKSFKDRKAFITALQNQAKILGLAPIPIVDKGSSEDSAGEQEDDDEIDSTSASKSAVPPIDSSAGTASPPPNASFAAHHSHHSSSSACPGEWANVSQTLTPPVGHVRSSSGKMRDSGIHFGSAEAPASTSWMASEGKAEKAHKESHRRTPSAVAASMFKSVSEKLRNISTSSSNITRESKATINSQSDLPSTPTGSSHAIPPPLGNSSENNSSGGYMQPVPLRSSAGAIQRDGSNGTSIPSQSTQIVQTPSNIALNGQHSASPSLTGSGSIPVSTHTTHSAPILIPTNKEPVPASSPSGPIGTPTKTAKDKGEKTSIFGAPGFLKDLSLPFHLPGSKRKRAASTSQHIEGPINNEGTLDASTSSESEEESDREREESRRLKYYLIHGDMPAGSGEEEMELEHGGRKKRTGTLSSLRQATSSITRNLVPDDDGSGLDPSSPINQRSRPRTASPSSTTDSSDSSDENSSTVSPMLSVRSHTTQDDPDVDDGAQDGPADARSSLSKKSRPPSSSTSSESDSPEPLIGSRGDASLGGHDSATSQNADGSRYPYEAAPLQLAASTHLLLSHNLHASAPPPQFNKPLEDMDRSDELETISKVRQSAKVGSGHIRAVPSTGSPRGAPPSTSFNRDKDVTPTLLQPKFGPNHSAAAPYLVQSHNLISPSSKNGPLLNQSYAGSTRYGGAREDDSISDSASDSIAGSTDHSSSSPVRSRKGDASSITSANRIGNSGDSYRKKGKSLSNRKLNNNVSTSRGSIGKTTPTSSSSHGAGTLGKSGKLKKSSHVSNTGSAHSSSSDLHHLTGKKHKHKRRSHAMRIAMLGAKTTCFGFVLALAILLRVMIGATLTQAQGNVIGAVAASGMSKSQKFFELVNLSFLTAIGTLLSQMMSVLVAPKVLAPRLKSRGGLLCENVFVRDHIVPLLVLVAGHCVAVCFGIALLACAPLYAPAHTLAFLNANANLVLLRAKTCALYVLFSSVGCHLIARHHSGGA